MVCTGEANTVSVLETSTRSSLSLEIVVDDEDVDEAVQQRSESDIENNREQKTANPGCHPPKQIVCCPLTNEPLRDPVVHPKNGASYERQAILSEEEGNSHFIFYPNRALKDYMDPATDPQTELVASCKNKRGIFCCPITCDLMRDPVIDKEGNTYERSAILEWIHEHGVSPITRNPLKAEELYDNTTLLTILLHEIQEADETLNPEEIQEWKNEVSSVYPERVTVLDPPLSALRLALRPPPRPAVRDPSLSTLRQALGTLENNSATISPETVISPEEQVRQATELELQRADSIDRLYRLNRQKRHFRWICRFLLLILLGLAIYLSTHWHHFVMLTAVMLTGAWMGATGTGCCESGPGGSSLSSALNNPA